MPAEGFVGTPSETIPPQGPKGPSHASRRLAGTPSETILPKGPNVPAEGKS